MRPLIQLEAESWSAGSGCGAAGGAAAADSSRLMGVDRLGRRSGGKIRIAPVDCARFLTISHRCQWMPSVYDAHACISFSPPRDC